MTARAIACFVASLIIGFPAFAQQRRQPDTKGPSALDSHAARLEHDAAEDLKAGKLATGRFVDLDIVFPGDKGEYEAVGKRALMVFALFSNDQTELPLARAYVGGVVLKCTEAVPRDVPPDSATAKSFGKYRADTLCLLPMDVERKSSRVTIDFTRNKQGLEVSSYSLSQAEPDFVKADIDPGPGPAPDPAALREFVEREYPGFGFQVQP